MKSKKVIGIGAFWILAGIISILIGICLNVRPQPAYNCPFIPSSPTRTEMLHFINATQHGNDVCAMAALDYYGQGALNAYNISVNLTRLGSPYISAHGGTIFIVIGLLAIIVGLAIMLLRRRIEREVFVLTSQRRGRGGSRVRG